VSALHDAWAALAPRLVLLEPLAFAAGDWSVLERLHARFDDREAQTRLPMPLARFRPQAVAAIHEMARRFDDVRTAHSDSGAHDAMAPFARLYSNEVDALMAVLVPPARYRKGHYAYGRFTVPEPHGLHTDHSAEDPSAAGEPICIARIATLGTLCLAGDYRTHDDALKRRLMALRTWTAVTEGEPERVLADLVAQGTLRAIPVDHVVLMVAGNASPDTQVTQHIAARPPPGGIHSTFFQRQYRLA